MDKLDSDRSLDDVDGGSRQVVSLVVLCFGWLVGNKEKCVGGSSVSEQMDDGSIFCCRNTPHHYRRVNTKPCAYDSEIQFNSSQFRLLII